MQKVTQQPKRRPQPPPRQSVPQYPIDLQSDDDYDDVTAEDNQSARDDYPDNIIGYSSDEEPQYKVRRVELNHQPTTTPRLISHLQPNPTHAYPFPECSAHHHQSIAFQSFPNMAMPEFTIDKDIKHFIYDMTAYLQYQTHLSEPERARLILVGVKGTAKDVIMGYTTDETNTTEKVFRLLRQEFKRHDKCAAGLYGIKQESEEKISIFAGKIRKYVRGLGVRQEKFDQACIDFLKLGCLPHIKTRLIQLHPRTFQRALKIATESESENAKVAKNKSISNMEIIDAPEDQNQQKEIARLCTIIQEQDRRLRNLSQP